MEDANDLIASVFGVLFAVFAEMGEIWLIFICNAVSMNALLLEVC